jgi:hypothetical protein
VYLKIQLYFILCIKYLLYIFRIRVSFNKANGDKITAEGKKGDSLLDVIVNNNLDFDGFGIIIKHSLSNLC